MSPFWPLVLGLPGACQPAAGQTAPLSPCSLLYPAPNRLRWSPSTPHSWALPTLTARICMRASGKLRRSQRRSWISRSTPPSYGWGTTTSLPSPCIAPRGRTARHARTGHHRWAGSTHGPPATPMPPASPGFRGTRNRASITFGPPRVLSRLLPPVRTRPLCRPISLRRLGWPKPPTSRSPTSPQTTSL